MRQLGLRPVEQPPDGMPAAPANRPRVRLGAVIAIAIAGSFVLWAAIGGCGDGGSSVAPTGSQGTEPVALSASGLSTLTAELPDPVYWVGMQAERMYELSQTADGKRYVRYLPPGVKAGDSRTSADGRHVSAGRRLCGDGERLEAGRVGGYPGARRRRRVPRRRERNQRLRGIRWFGLPDRGLRPDSGPRPPARRAGGGGARAVQGGQRHREQGQPIRSRDDCFDAWAADLLGGARARDHARADERDERPDLRPLPPERRRRRRPWAVPHRRDVSIRERLRGDEGGSRARSG